MILRSSLRSGPPRQADVIYPLDQDLLAGILQDVTGAKVAAWQWLTDGAQL